MKILNRYIILLSVVLVAVYACSATVFIDTSFGVNGLGLIHEGSDAFVTKVVTQTDGKICALGMCTLAGVPTIFIARFTTAGVLDTTFNTTGIVTLNYGTSVFASSIAVQADGKILVAGYTTVSGALRLLLARYTGAGAPDGTFGTSGIVTQLIGTSTTAFAMAEQIIGPTTYILVAGQATVDGTSSAFVTRYDNVGVVDPTFGTSGVVTTQVGLLPTPMAMVVLGDDTILIAGSVIEGNREVLLARYTSGGVLDTAFGTQGIVTTAVTDSVDDAANDVVIQGDGNIVIVGRSQISDLGQILLARYSSLGVLDPTFGTGGITTTSVGTEVSGTTVNLKADGTFVVSASADVGVVAGYLTDGALDTSFGDNGFIRTTLVSPISTFPSCLDASERILVGASVGQAGAVARYWITNADVIAITLPVDGSTITDPSFTILGSATKPNYTVKVYMGEPPYDPGDYHLIATITTDANGYWNAGSFIATNGYHKIYAELWNGALVATSPITTIGVLLGYDVVTIASPANGATITTGYINMYGGSTRSGYTVQVTLDGSVITSTTTDSSGQWNAGTWAVSDGSHNIQADLLTTGASTLNSFTVSSLIGPMGPTGYSGVSGSTGDTGFSGDSGLTGLTGVTGLSGDSGATGTTGMSGQSGVTGFSGITGRTGTTGLSGVTGFSGVTGYSGITGFSGVTGVSGATGKTGETGISGATGFSGITGDTGLIGLSGLTGDSGLTGISGLTGLTGDSGSTGVTGGSGTTGSSGLTGFTGLSGVTGFSGITGISGITGLSGSSGITGLTGGSGLTGSTGATGISPEGNVIRVDAVYGNDATCLRNRWDLPCSTVGKALSLAQPGYTVWVFPGVYDESGLTIPDGSFTQSVAVRGLDIVNTVIQKAGVTADTDMITMGENTMLQDVSVILQSNEHHTLRGIVFPGTTSTTAILQNVYVLVDNSAASAGDTSNVYGIHSTGTGTAYVGIPSMLASTSNVVSIGNGNKRALYNNAANYFSAATSNFYAACPLGSCTGSYMGVEVDNADGIINLIQSNVQGPVIDISQTSGTMILALTVLGNSNANGLIFNAAIQPALLEWGDNGTLTASSPIYLRPGQNTSSTTINNITLGHHCVIKRLIVRARVAPGAGRTDTFTVMKNGVATAVTCSLTGTAPGGQNASDTTHSVHFDAGDLLAIQVVRSNTSNPTADVIATVEVY